MPTQRSVLRLVALAMFATLLCGVVLLGFESSSMLTELRSSASRLTFLRGESLSQYGLSDELMTVKLINEIESQKTQIKNASSNLTSPMHVHMLWIGDLAKAPVNRLKYAEMGYKLTVHTSAEEILDGFQPYVLTAYKLAVPTVVGYDFLKLAMLYKFGGLSVDADTFPAIPAAELQWPADCDVVFGKEVQVGGWEKPIYRPHGGPTYGMNRPFQVLNWAMAASQPRNPHIKQLIKGALMHFFGRRDIEGTLIQDVSGSGLISDYVALLHEREGRSFPGVYRDESKYVPVQGLCLTDGYLRGDWVHHSYLGSWQT